MKKDNIIHIVGSLLLPVYLLCIHACTVANLDLCIDEHPHRGQLIIDYDWSGLNIEHPDSMVVMALRPVFRDKMASNWATSASGNENRLYGRFIASAAGDDNLYYSSFKDNPSRDSLFLPAGEWTISSYTSNPSTVGLVKEYATDVMDDGGNLYFKLDVSERLPEKYAYWYDRNSYGGWVEASANSSVCLASGYVVIDEFANVKKNYRMKLSPRIVAQKVNVGFEAEIVDSDIVVDSIVCAMSGIADAMNLNTMELDIDATHQTIFGTELSRTSDKRISARSTIYVPGLVRSSSSSLLQGPGILNVSVFVSYTDDKNVSRKRRLDATLNLFRLLSATPSVRYDENGRVMQACTELNLLVQSRMLISKDKLSNADDALDSWVDETIIDVEI